MKTGVSTACLYPLEPERSLDLLLQLGYRRFEVFPNCMEELSPAYLRDLKGPGGRLRGGVCVPAPLHLGDGVLAAVRRLPPPHPGGF